MQDRLQELFPVHYRNGNILMINADCMEVMKHIKEKETELSCVDPPYGIGLLKTQAGNYGIGKTKKDNTKPWDNSKPDKNYFDELFRVSKNQIIWGANNFTCIYNFPSSSSWICWDKLNGESYWSDFELAYSSFGIVDASKSNKTGARFIKMVSERNFPLHPTAKPVALYKWLLSRYAKPGDRILDTHGGSGSICIACHDLGFPIIWVEKESDYYRDAVKRVKTHQAQEMLFTASVVAPVQLTMGAFDE